MSTSGAGLYGRLHRLVMPPGRSQTALDRRATRAWTQLDATFYRRLGWSPAARLMKVDVLRLTTIGRRSGRRRSVLVACLPGDDGTIVIGGGNWGWDHDPGWLHNLRVQPQCEVQRGRTTRAMVATILEGPAADVARADLVAAYPHSQAYVERRVRPVPAVRLSPAS